MTIKTLLLALFLSALLPLSGCSWLASYRADIQNAAEANACVHADKLHWKLSGVSCSDQDSNNDYYYSCDVEVIEPNGTMVTKSIECGAGLGSVTGCRKQRVTLTNGVNE